MHINLYKYKHMCCDICVCLHMNMCVYVCTHSCFYLYIYKSLYSRIELQVFGYAYPNQPVKPASVSTPIIVFIL